MTAEGLEDVIGNVKGERPRINCVQVNPHIADYSGIAFKGIATGNGGINCAAALSLRFELRRIVAVEAAAGNV